ncbi:MAG: TadE/TadG family type IV pilus assembly protein [Gemmatales bacterium]|nr:pilus assembly protein [Gemmatales bacterium]MDW8174557.1 TadE/TadG family type IV pilus assembly protein [Gemmatales bacterium]MDW8221927.1 TadE/TadG family type IV pilus assembly protein [Gemmatales bacterium]
MVITNHQRRGIATVELAVALPLLLLLMLGIWEIARFIEVQQILNNAAREAGRQVAGGGKSIEQVRQGLISFLQSASINPAQLELSVSNLSNLNNTDPREAYSLDVLEVRVSVPYRNVSLSLTSMFIPENARIRSHVVWRSLRDLPVTVDIHPPVE